MLPSIHTEPELDKRWKVTGGWSWKSSKQHRLAGQLGAGHRYCDLLVIMVPSHDLYNVTLFFRPAHPQPGEAEHSQNRMCLAPSFLCLEDERAGVAWELTDEEKLSIVMEPAPLPTSRPGSTLLTQETPRWHATSQVAKAIRHISVFFEKYI